MKKSVSRFFQKPYKNSGWLHLCHATTELFTTFAVSLGSSDVFAGHSGWTSDARCAWQQQRKPEWAAAPWIKFCVMAFLPGPWWCEKLRRGGRIWIFDPKESNEGSMGGEWASLLVWNKWMEINPPKKGRLIESRSGSASKGDIAGIMGFMSP